MNIQTSILASLVILLISCNKKEKQETTKAQTSEFGKRFSLIGDFNGDKKAPTIPKSLGGQNFNKHVCDGCNKYFGETTKINGYSIKEALKETFCLSRKRFLGDKKTKKQIGIFKSKFFDSKERNGKKRVVLKRAFLFKSSFHFELFINFKKGQFILG